MEKDLTKVKFEIIVCMLASDERLRNMVKNLLKWY